jgi:chitin deacetylase
VIKVIIVFASALLISIAVFVALWWITKSTTFQVFGEIYAKAEIQHKAIALTFDDGPTRERTDEILSILREENVKATFYLIGRDMEVNPGEAEKIVADQHEVGNHSFNHDRMVLVTPEFVRNEIEKTDDLIRKAGFANEITFRPPYGKKLFVLPYYLSENGRKTISWDIAPENVAERSDDIIRYTLENTRSGSIILLHVAYRTRDESLKSVRPIIKGLKEKGFEFKTVSELLAMQNR